MTKMTNAPKVIELADRLFELMAEARPKWDPSGHFPPSTRGGPASEAELDALEQRFGFALPADYRTFLSHYRSWSSFDGPGKLLAPDEHDADWVQAVRADFTEHWDSGFEPLAAGQPMVLAGKDLPYFIVLDSRQEKRNADGEPTFVEYEDNSPDDTYATFCDYLEHRIEVMQIMLEDTPEP